MVIELPTRRSHTLTVSDMGQGGLGLHCLLEIPVLELLNTRLGTCNSGFHACGFFVLFCKENKAIAENLNFPSSLGIHK